MLVSQFFTRTNNVLRGIEDDVPISGTDEYAYWLDTLNRKKDELYRDIKKWSNIYQVLEVGTITASNAPEYELAEEFLAPANNVYVLTVDGNRTEYEIIKPQEVNPNKQQVYIAGGNPQILYFTQPILADSNIVDGTLYIPGYFMPDDMISANDELPFSDPNWAVMAVASEIAFNDLTYEDKAPDLNSKANALYAQMVKLNRRGTYDNPRVTPTNVRRITSPGR